MATQLGTYENTYQVVFYDSSAGTYSVRSGVTAVDYFSDTADVGDYVMFGWRNNAGTTYGCPPMNLKLYVGTALSASSIEVVWEMASHEVDNKAAGQTGGNWSLATWSEVKVIDTSNTFQNTGAQYVYFFSPMNVTEFVSNLPTGVMNLCYWIRCRITSVSSLTQGGANSTNAIQASQHAIFMSTTSETFSSLLTADTAGTLDLLPASTCTTGMTCLDPQLAGEPSIQLDCVLSGTSAGAGDTLDISGTDANGGSISESIDVSGGDGTYTTTNYYKTVDNVDCTGWSDGTLQIYQGKWGVLSNPLTYQYDIYGNIIVTSGTLSDTDKVIIFHRSTRCPIYVNGSGTATFGQLTGGYGQHGCSFAFSRMQYMADISAVQARYGNLNFYDCVFDCQKLTIAAALNIYDSQVKGAFLFNGAGNPSSTCNIVRVHARDTCQFQSIPANTTINGLSLYGQYTNLYMYGNMTFRGVDIPYYLAFGGGQTNQNAYAIDSTYGAVYLAASNTNTHTHIQYSFNLKVADTDGNGIENATVTLTDVDDTEVFSETTDSNGEIDEQIVEYQDWYYSGSLQHDDFSPHILTISKPGYLTQSHEITVNEKKDLIFTLEESVGWIMPMGNNIFKNLDKTNIRNKFKWLKL